MSGDHFQFYISTYIVNEVIPKMLLQNIEAFTDINRTDIRIHLFFDMNVQGANVL